MLLLLAVAIAPGLAICLLIYSWDKYEKEPISHLLVSFLLGIAATIPALLIQSFTHDVRDDSMHHSVWDYAWYAFAVVGLSEEGSKYLMLRLYAYPKKAFSEPFDGIVYGVMVGMGFATVENIEYVRQFGLETGVVRFFLSVPAHAAFAVLMGYYVGLAKFNKGGASLLMWKGLLIAVLFHGSFDFFLFLQQSQVAKQYVSAGLLSFGAFISFYIAIRLALRAIRMHTQLPGKEYTEL